MDARLLVESKWMVSTQFGLGDVPKEPLVTIAKVGRELQEGDKGKEVWGLLFFREPWAKPLKVNGTSRNALIMMFGGETDAWVGKRIGLHVIRGTFFGRQSTAVRIKGSPDIKAPMSFTVKKYGGGNDVYDLRVLTASGAAVGPVTTVTFGNSKTLRGKAIADLDVPTLDALVLEGEALCTATPAANWVTAVRAGMAAMRAEVERRAVPPSAAPEPSEPPPPISDDEAAAILAQEKEQAGQ